MVYNMPNNSSSAIKPSIQRKPSSQPQTNQTTTSKLPFDFVSSCPAPPSKNHFSQAITCLFSNPQLCLSCLLSIQCLVCVTSRSFRSLWTHSIHVNLQIQNKLPPFPLRRAFGPVGVVLLGVCRPLLMPGVCRASFGCSSGLGRFGRCVSVLSVSRRCPAVSLSLVGGSFFAAP